MIERSSCGWESIWGWQTVERLEIKNKLTDGQVTVTTKKD